MKTAVHNNIKYSGCSFVALRMFKRDDISHSPITIEPLSSGVRHGAQSIATIH